MLASESRPFPQDRLVSKSKASQQPERPDVRGQSIRLYPMQSKIREAKMEQRAQRFPHQSLPPVISEQFEPHFGAMKAVIEIPQAALTYGSSIGSRYDRPGHDLLVPEAFNILLDPLPGLFFGCEGFFADARRSRIVGSERMHHCQILCADRAKQQPSRVEFWQGEEGAIHVH
jgi:hypothetical protein